MSDRRREWVLRRSTLLRGESEAKSRRPRVRLFELGEGGGRREEGERREEEGMRRVEGGWREGEEEGRGWREARALT
jgi:hypothetical protein